MTPVRDALLWGRGRLGTGEGAFLEAEILLSRTLGRSREWMAAHDDEAVPPREYEVYRGLIDRRADTGIPVAYLTGQREFAGMDFIVRPGVLVPRPETESLVEAVVAWMAGPGAGFPGGALVDAGCGSGIIAVSLARSTGRRVFATDISPVALAVAGENVRRHGVEGLVTILGGSWLQPVMAGPGVPPVCAVVSNPPYVPSSVIETLERDVRDFEPREALDGGADGLDSIRLLAREAGALLPPGGLLAMEIGEDQASAVASLLGSGGWVKTAVIRDLAGLSRVVTAEKQAS